MFDWLRETMCQTEVPEVQTAHAPPELQPAGNAAAQELLQNVPILGPMFSELYGDIDQAVDPNTVYIGTHRAVAGEETGALPSWAAVADGTDTGKVKSKDGKTDLSLERPEDIRAFLRDTGVDQARSKPDGSAETPEEIKARMDALEKVMTSAGPQSRDNLAELMQTVQKAESGELQMERIVISGHHNHGASDIHGDATLSYQQLGSIMEQFPTARAGVKDVMTQACNTNNSASEAEIWKDMFPNLESFWGYTGSAPSIGKDEQNSSPAHIAAWERATRGNDPERVAEGAKGRVNARATTF